MPSIKVKGIEVQYSGKVVKNVVGSRVFFTDGCWADVDTEDTKINGVGSVFIKSEGFFCEGKTKEQFSKPEKKKTSEKETSPPAKKTETRRVVVTGNRVKNVGAGENIAGRHVIIDGKIVK